MSSKLPGEARASVNGLLFQWLGSISFLKKNSFYVLKKKPYSQRVRKNVFLVKKIKENWRDTSSYLSIPSAFH